MRLWLLLSPQNQTKRRGIVGRNNLLDVRDELRAPESGRFSLHGVLPFVNAQLLGLARGNGWAVTAVFGVIAATIAITLYFKNKKRKTLDFQILNDISILSGHAQEDFGLRYSSHGRR